MRDVFVKDIFEDGVFHISFYSVGFGKMYSRFS